MVNGARRVPMEDPAEQVEKVPGTLTDMWGEVKFFAVAASRFATRMALDDEGKPSTARVIVWPWMVFSAFIYWRSLGITGNEPVPLETVVSVTLVTLAVILWAAAVKLGVGVFVPLAEAVGGIVSRAGRTVRSMVAQYAGGPPREQAMNAPGGELFRARAVPEDVPPEQDDETGGGP